nr:Fic family protein [Methylomarinum sp. Ch1-1]MDP4523329.1 Fic family protein [Methylomarinum sp. Ch1-1]
MIDDYLYSGTQTLINRFGIQDKAVLDQIESDITADRVRELLAGDPDFNVFSDNLDEKLLRGIHKHLFVDLYEWAGDYRHCDVAKAEPLLNRKSVDYPPPYSFFEGEKLMEDAIKESLSQLGDSSFKTANKEEYIDKLARFATDLWVAHPFREGNTRTVTIFLRAVAKFHGKSLSGNLNNEEDGLRFRDMLVMASVGDADPLKQSLRRSLKFPKNVANNDISFENMSQKLQGFRRKKLLSLGMLKTIWSRIFQQR